MSTFDYNCLRNLPYVQQQIICFVALTNRMPEGKLLDSFCQSIGVSYVDVMEGKRLLTSEGLLCYSDNYGRVVSGMYRLLALCYLVEINEDWLDCYMQLLQFQRLGEDEIKAYNFAFSLCAGTDTVLQKNYQSSNEILLRLCYPLVGETMVQNVLSRIPVETFQVFIKKIIPWLLEHDLVAADALLAIWETKSEYKMTLKEEWQNTRLYCFFATGMVVEGESDSWQGHVIQAIHALMRGEEEEALSEMIKAESSCFTRTNFVPFPDYISNYFFAVALSKDKKIDGRIRLNRIAQNYSVERNVSALVIHILATYFKDSSRKVDDRSMRILSELCDNGASKGYVCMSFLLSSFMKRYRDYDLNNIGYLPNLWILRNELSSVMPILAEQENLKPVITKAVSIDRSLGRTAQQRSTTTPVEIKHDRQMPTPAQVLKKQKETVPAELAEPIDHHYRLAYVVTIDGSISVYSRDILTEGVSAFYPLSAEEYRTGRIPKAEIDNSDRQVWNSWYSHGFKFNLEDVLAKLGNSNKLFVRSHGGEIRQVRLVFEALYIEVKQDTSGLWIDSNYTAEQLRSAYRTIFDIKPDRISYSSFPESSRAVLYTLLSTRLFSLESEEKLHDMVMQLIGHVVVKGDSYAAGAKAKVYEGQSNIVVQVYEKKNTKNMRQIRLMARPIENEALLCDPGEGEAVRKVYISGSRTDLRRNLSGEIRNMYDLFSFMRSIGCEVPTEQLHNTPYPVSAQELLQIMDYVKDHSEIYSIEWKSAQPLRLYDLEGKDLRLNIRQREQWLELEGEVRLDEDRSQSVREFFNGVLSQSHSGYVQVGELEYVRLSDKLRSQIERLASGFHDNGHRLLGKEMSAAQVADAMTGEIEVSGSDFLKGLQDKMRASLNADYSVPEGLCATLRPYQNEGFVWMSRLASIGAGACLADDMGLGKTLQSITFLLSRSSEGASIVFVPASVVKNWESEIRRFAPSLNPIILNSGKDRKKRIEDSAANDVIIATYGLMVSMAQELESKEWCVICLDEAHTIKNKTTQTSEAAMNLKGKYRLALTGTPIQNNLSELWNIFQFLNPGLLGGFESFSRKFVYPIMNSQNLERQEQLKRIISPFMLRRTKSEVVKELPKKEEKTILVNLTDGEMEAYEHIRQEVLAETKDAKQEKGNKVEILSQITKLRLAACATRLISKDWTGSSSKLRAFRHVLDDVMSQPDSRVLIFSQFTSFLSMVGEWLKQNNMDYLYLDGNIPIRERSKLVDKFQKGECPLFLISLQAGGLGLNLTLANHVILMDPWWNPAIEQQAIDRAYRIGQQRDVSVVHLISANTIEEKIVRLQKTKKDMASALLSGEEMTKGITYDEILELVQS